MRQVRQCPAQYNIIDMTNHIKIWTPEEDDFLRRIVSESKQIKWGAVAYRLQAEFMVYGRTGKQCRQRWVNYLNPNLKMDAWTPEQQCKLFEFHSLHGNRWSLISKELNGRPDNSIKNHFYSALRKGLRRVNKFITQSLKRSFARPVPVRFISKILMIAESLDSTSVAHKEIASKCHTIRNELVYFSKDTEEAPDGGAERDRLIDLVRMILEVNRAYRKKRVGSKRRSDPIIRKVTETTAKSPSQPAKIQLKTEQPTKEMEPSVYQNAAQIPVCYAGWAVTPIYIEQPSLLAISPALSQPLYLSFGSNAIIANSNFMLPLGSYT